MEHDLTIEGHGVRLVPLEPRHAEALLPLVDARMWVGMTSPVPQSVEDAETWIAAALQTPARLAFAVTDPATGEVRGSTSFYDLDHSMGRVEIGHTFYGRPWWGGTTNPASKLALLTQAFEVWGLHRVALRADTRNERSIAAILRLGAVAEGVLRGHRVGGDGFRGDTAYFSVLAPEWPAVRAGLRARLGLAQPDAQAGVADRAADAAANPAAADLSGASPSR